MAVRRKVRKTEKTNPDRELEAILRRAAAYFKTRPLRSPKSISPARRKSASAA